MSMKPWMMVVLALISVGCASGNGVKGTRQRTAEGFTKIKIESGIQATVAIGPSAPLVLEGDDNLLDDIFMTKVEGDTLVASLGWSIPTMPFKLSVTMPSLDSVTASGASKVTAADLSGIQPASLDVRFSGASTGSLDNLNATAVNLELSGASAITLGNLTATRMTLDAGGGSTVEVTGVGTTPATELTANLTGGSVLKASTFPIDTGTVDASASSSAEVQVTNSISGTLIRASWMTVAGNPPTRNVVVFDTSTVTYL